MLLHTLSKGSEEEVEDQGTDDSSQLGVLRAISMIPATPLWDWTPIVLTVSLGYVQDLNKIDGAALDVAIRQRLQEKIAIVTSVKL